LIPWQADSQDSEALLLPYGSLTKKRTIRYKTIHHNKSEPVALGPGVFAVALARECRLF